jgi:hypothetical protein
MQKINDFVSWGFSSGFFVVLVWFLWGYVKPLLDAKVKHAKTAQEKELLNLLIGWGDTEVTALVGRTDLTGQQKFEQATKAVRGVVEAKGLTATEDMIQSAVQSAYEKSDLTPNSTKKSTEPTTGTVVNGESTEDPVLKTVEQAPNRVNDVEEG